MPDITIVNLRVAPGAGPRVPTTVKAFARASFLLSDADATAVSETSPYDQGTPFKSVALTPNAPYYEAVDFTLPSTTDSLDNPTGARWGLFVYDANDRLMFPVAGLESFALDATNVIQDAAEIISFNGGTLPAEPHDVHVTGDLEVDGNFDADGTSTFHGPAVFEGTVQGAVKSFNGRAGIVVLTSADLNGLSGAGLTGIGTGTGGIINTGSTTIGADSDSDGVGVVALQTRGVTRFQVRNDGKVDVLEFAPALAARLGLQQVVYVTQFATGGDGTSGNPYTGWDAAIGTFLSNTTYLFDAGKYYSYSTPIVILNTTNTRLVGAGPFFLKFTGTGIALTVKSTALGGHYYNGIENAVIIGNANATEGLYLEASHHAFIRADVRDVSQKAFHFKFAVGGTYYLRCSQNGNPFSVVPVNGIYTEILGGGETFQRNEVYAIIEGMSGDGVVLSGARQNRVVGTSEGNGGRGVYILSGSSSNRIEMDNESNGAADFDLYGDFNVLDNVLSTGLTVIRSGSKKNVIRGGELNSLTIESGASFPYLENVNYNIVGTGVLTLSEPTTTIWGVFTDITAGGSGGGNVIVANPINFATTSTGPAWATSLFNVLNIGAAASIFAHKATTNPGLNMPVNAYFDGADWRYRFTGLAASNVYQQAGETFFMTAPSGTAGSVITWTTVGKFGADGKLYVNDGGALKAVTYGANDSGGTGFKLLRITN